MEKTLGIAALTALALGVAGPGAAEDHQGGSAGERLDEAGFVGARVLPGIELAWAEDDRQRRFLVISGLDRMGALGASLAPEHLAADPAEPERGGESGPTAAEIDEAAEIGLRLADLLDEAGIAAYHMLDDAHVGEMIVGTDGAARPIHILFGFESERE